MKRIISTTAFLIALTAFVTSCNKEYVCECDNGAYSQIIEASSKSSAESDCNTKGTSCSLQ
ncbi:MAG: hypothetical protein H6551_04360 [Chitinophagales bacterium]|nr:hypothetical protein [Chitinophagaceae bacterium]MCB9064357.1 hypothetical protein [Chitinophagales bacterium]